ncbi:hypothetical protein COCON_G00199910, partial [Conger conger]
MCTSASALWIYASLEVSSPAVKRNNCCSLDVYCFCENPWRSAAPETLRPPCLAPTIIQQSKSLLPHSSPIWSEKQLNLL